MKTKLIGKYLRIRLTPKEITKIANGDKDMIDRLITSIRVYRYKVI